MHDRTFPVPDDSEGDQGRAAEMERLVALLDSPGLVAATSQRVILHRHLRAHGLATPPLHGVVGRAGGWSAASGRPVLGTPAVSEFLAGLPGALVVLPSGASAAEGLRVVPAGPDGAPTDARALAEEILADPVHELFVVMGLPGIDEAVRGLMPDAALPAARLTTLVSDEGEVEVVHAYLRALPESAGQRARRIDPEDGVVAVDGIPRQLPHWPGACELARRGSALLLPQRTLGWDVAFTDTGPVVIDVVSAHGWVPDVGFDAVLARLRAATVPVSALNASAGSS